MTNEQLRMQFIGGIITESEYKAKIEENKSSKSKKSLNENIVSIGAINNPFPTRKKSDYELAFEYFTKGGLNEEMDSNIGKEELVNKIKNLGDFGFTGDKIEFNGLLITCSTQEDEGGPYYFVYTMEDEDEYEGEDGIFKSTNPNEIAEFVFNY